MADKIFDAMEHAYLMSEAEWLRLKNQVFLLRRHHIRDLRQLQLFAQRGIAPTHPLYVRAHKRLRHLERRIDAIQHKLAHAQRYETLVEPESEATIWSAVGQWVRHVWSRTKQKQGTA